MEYIGIDKNSIPYKFDIRLGGVTYTLRVLYNSLRDFFTVDLYKDNTPIVLGEKLVLNKPLFISSKYRDTPAVDIIPFDLTGEAERITFSNFNESVYLYILGDGHVD